MGPPRYILFWKPYDTLCQFSPGTTPEQTTLKRWIDVPQVYPAGRLDRDSEGLLLLTNHGAVQHRLCDPRFAHPRTYLAQVERTPTDEALDSLARGVVIKGGYRTRPATARRLLFEPDLPPRTPPIRQRKHIETAWIELILTEGKNRQVRRMTASVGFPTLRLVRVSLSLSHASGTDEAARPPSLLTLEGLSPGQWRDLTPEEVRALLDPLSPRRPKSPPHR